MEFINWLSSFLPKELITFLAAGTPFFELRGSIPLGVVVFHLSLFSAYFFSVLGNLVPVVFIFLFLRYLSGFLMVHSKIMNKLLNRLFNKVRLKHKYKFDLWGPLALIGFVAIPLPLTGAWTGTVAAFVFGVPLKRTLFFITLGVLISGMFVTLFTRGLVVLF